MTLHEQLRKAVAADKRTRKAIADASGMTDVTLSRFMTDPGYQLSGRLIENRIRVLRVKVKLSRPSR